MDSETVQILYSVQSLLRYHKVIGINDYPAGEATSSFLQTVDVPVAFTPVVSQKSQDLSDAVVKAVPKKVGETCEDIAGEVRSCTGCILHTKRLSTDVEVGGSNQPKLFIVGGWLSEGIGTSLSADSVFGLEEDRMVSRMLAAINLSSDEAFITNVIKCSVPGDCEPSSENIRICFSFLQRQIRVMNPKIICAMGIVATKALLKSAQPLSKLRGRVYSYAVSEQVAIPVIPTYHPTFLLKNQEFKRATWEDLQIIGKYLRKI